MNEKMDRKIFIKMCVSGGYATKQNAYAYCQRYPKLKYDSNDLIEAYRMEQERRFYESKKS